MKFSLPKNSARDRETFVNYKVDLTHLFCFYLPAIFVMQEALFAYICGA